MTHLSVSNLEQLGIVRPPFDTGFVFCYPPMPIAQFDGHAPSEDLFQELRMSKQPVGLFINIPFCEQICRFCTLVKKVPGQGEIPAYLSVLKQEISFYRRLLGETPISSVFFGGGTPSILSIEQLTDLFQMLRLTFQLDQAETTMEIYPTIYERREQFQQKLFFLKENSELPVQRVSMGIQSFDTAVLHEMGRQMNEDEVLDSIQLVHRIFPNFNLDLMYGYPVPPTSSEDRGQHLQMELTSMFDHIALLHQQGVELPSLTLYRLWTRSDTGLMRRVHKGERVLPSSADIARAKLLIHDQLELLGYHPSAVATYLRTNAPTHRWSRNRWQDCNYIGIGAGAYGFTTNHLFIKNGNIPAYIQRYAQHGVQVFAPPSLYRLSAMDRMHRYLILGLRLQEGISLHKAAAIGECHTIPDETMTKIERLIDLDLVTREQDILRLTSYGFAFGDDVCEYLYPYDLVARMQEIRETLAIQHHARAGIPSTSVIRKNTK
jgi:Coproporphyrinogen III oxidase and related Fe-S oxidoreductases